MTTPDTPNDKVPSDKPGSMPDDHLTDAVDFLEEEGLPQETGPEADGPLTNPLKSPQTPLSKNTVGHEAFDNRLYREIFEASTELAALPDHPAAPETMPELLEDFFYALFKVKPKVVEGETLEPEHARINLPFVERLLEDERTSILRLSTTMDDMASALGALEAGRNAVEEIENNPDLSSWAHPPEPNPDEDHDPPQEPPQDPPQGPSSKDVRRLLRKSLEAAQEAVDEYNDALNGWGISAGDLKQVPLSERLEIARKLRTPRMADFAALLGKMRDAATSASATALTTGTDDVHSITTGGPLSQVLPQEFTAGLAADDSVLEANFYRKMAEGTLLSYELTGPQDQNRGPVICMVDASPSMAGTPMDWASALAAALAQGPAARDGRPVYLLYFNTHIVKEIRLEPHDKDPRKLLDLTTVGTSGGTDFDAPVNRALQIISADPDYETSDLILVTDGQCRLSEEGRSALEAAAAKTDLSLYAVLCGNSATAADVDRYATAVYSAEHDLAESPVGQAAATDIFRNL